MYIKTKEYGKLSAQQLKDLYAHSHKFKQKQKELDELAKEESDLFTKIFELRINESSHVMIPPRERFSILLIEFSHSLGR